MIGRRRLRKPHVAAVAGEVTGRDGIHHGIAVDQFRACGVDQVRAALHPRDHRRVEQPLGGRVQRNLQVDDIDGARERRRIGVIRERERLLDRRIEPMALRVVQMQAERLQPAQHREADAPRADRAEMHPFDVVAARHAVGDVPAALLRDRMRRQVVAHQRERRHHHVLGDADAVRAGDFGNGDVRACGRIQVDVIGADAGRQRELQLRRAGDPFGAQVRGPERLRNHHVGFGQPAFEFGVGAVLVARDDQRVAVRFHIAAQAERAGHRADELAGPEAKRAGRCRRGLAVRVVRDDRDRVAHVARRIAVDGIGVEHAQDGGHRVVLL
ncbi:hypothetical protein I35_7636 [Burkholderia cenocepacia H111]|nr:hypothetical protein I35_7636 [Burkholderia cenocepacia H111]